MPFSGAVYWILYFYLRVLIFRERHFTCIPGLQMTIAISTPPPSPSVVQAAVPSKGGPARKRDRCETLEKIGNIPSPRRRRRRQPVMPLEAP